MKRIVLLLSAISFLACTKQMEDEIINPNPQTMAEMNVSENFNYETSSAMSGLIRVSDLEDNAMPSVRIEIYDALPEEGGSLLSSGMTNASGTYEPFGVIPAHLEQVVVVCHAMGFPNVVETPVSNGSVSVDFGGSKHKAVSGSGKTSGTTQISSAGGNCYYLSSYDNQGVPSNFLNPNDNIDQAFLDMVNNSLPERAPVPTANPQYLANGNSTDIKVLTTF
jgi:hypothetical protein